MSLYDFFSSKSSESDDDQINQASIINSNNTEHEASENLEYSHSSTTNHLTDHEITIEKDATSSRKKNPFGMENAI
jgi:hypothetical protein